MMDHSALHAPSERGLFHPAYIRLDGAVFLGTYFRGADDDDMSAGCASAIYEACVPAMSSVRLPPNSGGVWHDFVIVEMNSAFVEEQELPMDTPLDYGWDWRGTPSSFSDTCVPDAGPAKYCLKFDSNANQCLVPFQNRGAGVWSLTAADVHKSTLPTAAMVAAPWWLMRPIICDEDLASTTARAGLSINHESPLDTPSWSWFIVNATATPVKILGSHAGLCSTVCIERMRHLCISHNTNFVELPQLRPSTAVAYVDDLPCVHADEVEVHEDGMSVAFSCRDGDHPCLAATHADMPIDVLVFTRKHIGTTVCLQIGKMDDWRPCLHITDSLCRAIEAGALPTEAAWSVVPSNSASGLPTFYVHWCSSTPGGKQYWPARLACYHTGHFSNQCVVAMKAASIVERCYFGAGGAAGVELSGREADNSAAVAAACGRGHVNIAKQLAAATAADALPPVLLQHAFVEACTSGHLGVAQWLHNHCRSSGRMQPQCVLHAAITGACDNAHLGTAQWLVDVACLCGDTAWLCFALTACFQRACMAGDTATARWLAATHSVDVHAQNDRAFRLACNGGHRQLAEWLCCLYPATDIHACDEQAFAAACVRGDLPLAQWLWNRGGVTAYAARPAFPSRWPHWWKRDVFVRASGSGRDDVIQWLLHLQPARDRDDYWYAFLSACDAGQFATARWLLDHDSHAVFRHSWDTVFLHRCRRIRTLRTAQWLHSEFTRRRPGCSLMGKKWLWHAQTRLFDDTYPRHNVERDDSDPVVILKWLVCLPEWPGLRGDAVQDFFFKALDSGKNDTALWTEKSWHALVPESPTAPDVCVERCQALRWSPLRLAWLSMALLANGRPCGGSAYSGVNAEQN